MNKIQIASAIDSLIDAKIEAHESTKRDDMADFTRTLRAVNVAKERLRLALTIDEN